MELRSLFHLNHSVGTPIQLLKQNECSIMIIHNQRKNASAIFTISVKVMPTSNTSKLNNAANRHRNMAALDFYESLWYHWFDKNYQTTVI